MYNETYKNEHIKIYLIKYIFITRSEIVEHEVYFTISGKISFKKFYVIILCRNKIYSNTIFIREKDYLFSTRCHRTIYIMGYIYTYFKQIQN